MKILFVEAQRKLSNTDINNIDFSILPNKIYNIDFSILPNKIFLAYSIQYKPLALLIKKELANRISGMQQVLGCTKLACKEPILLIGSGKFHALNLALQDNIVYVLEDDTINKVEDKEIEKYRNKKKTALLKFLSSGKIGILVSCKSGQENLYKALGLEKKLEKQGKKASIFVTDTINALELENYNIDSWVNTACPGLVLDYPVLNIEDTDFN